MVERMMTWTDQTITVYYWLYTLCGIATLIVSLTDARTGNPAPYRVPDEQRLYQDLMIGYESSVRPVMNASKKIIINFRLSLNQIVDLDERKQVLTTNAFIDQEWEDDNLKWDVDEYNGIKTMRVPSGLVWLPDTFIFNNADDGATGFMSSVYVVLNANGTVLWPVPVKLKSSCHVDITYFPFDEQRCILRFGSWIYSGEWMDFDSSLESVDLKYFIENSAWELLAIQYEKSVRTYACCPSPHPDITYTLHIRRRTFYYIFNIIVPCIMLSVLTLLTFWLPTTSGEKISLGLSVFLAFSMFMLLIAEEVPATSKSVPLIGVYLTTVMTMTSVSVIMSVMVINLYNRGYRAQPAPVWLRIFILSWLCRLLRMKHDIERLAKSIRLEEEEEAKYMCEKHELAGVFPRRRFGRTPRPSPRHTPQPSPTGSPSSTPQRAPSPELLRQNNRVNNVRNCRSAELLRRNIKVNGTHELQSPDTNRQCRGINDVTDSKSLESLRHSNKISETDSKSSGHRRRKVNDVITTNGATRLFPYECGTHSFAKYPDMKGSPQHEALLRSGMNMDSRLYVHGDRQHVISEEYGDGEEPVWRKRDTLIKEEREAIAKKRRDRCQECTIEHTNQSTSKSRVNKNTINSAKVNKRSTLPIINADDGLDAFDDLLAKQDNSAQCNKHVKLVARREIVVEWQTMAMVIDRLLFWIFLLATVVAYIVILFIIPYSKPTYPDDLLPIRILKRS